MQRKEHFPAETNWAYILGAGASFADDNRFPLMKAVFKGFEDQDSNQHSYADTRKTLLKWLKNNYDNYQNENIEGILTYLDFLRSGYILAEKPSLQTDYSLQYKKIYSELIDYLHERLNINGNIEDLILHYNLLDKITQKDSIITFNYDETLDATLAYYNKKKPTDEKLPHFLNLQYLISKCESKGFVFSGLGEISTSQLGQGYLLKLHGSLFWKSCINNYCPNHFYINIGNESEDFLDEEGYLNKTHHSMFPDDPSFCNLCGGELEPVLIYPSAHKQISTFPKIKVMWQKAHRILSNATHYVIIGYSFPETDFNVRNLIRRSCYHGKGRSWRIVDPDWENVLKKLKPLIIGQSKSVSFFLQCYEGLEQFINDDFVEAVDEKYFHNL